MATTAATDEDMADMVVDMADMVVDMDMGVTDEATVDMAVMDTIKFGLWLQVVIRLLTTWQLTRDRT